MWKQSDMKNKSTLNWLQTDPQPIPNLSFEGQLCKNEIQIKGAFHLWSVWGVVIFAFRQGEGRIQKRYMASKNYYIPLYKIRLEFSLRCIWIVLRVENPFASRLDCHAQWLSFIFWGCFASQTIVEGLLESRRRVSDPPRWNFCSTVRCNILRGSLREHYRAS